MSVEEGPFDLTTTTHKVQLRIHRQQKRVRLTSGGRL